MEQTDEDFNYDSQYKKLCTGLGSFLNSAQENKYFEENELSAGGSSSSQYTSYSSDDLSKRKTSEYNTIAIFVKINIKIRNTSKN